MSSTIPRVVSETRQSLSLSDLISERHVVKTSSEEKEEKEDNAEEEEAEDVETDRFDETKELSLNEQMSEVTCDSSKFPCDSKTKLFTIADSRDVANNDPGGAFVKREDEESYASSASSILFRCINSFDFQTSSLTLNTETNTSRSNLRKIHDQLCNASRSSDASRIQRTKSTRDRASFLARPSILRLVDETSDRSTGLPCKTLDDMRAILTSLHPVVAKREVERLDVDGDTILHVCCRRRVPIDIIDLLLSISRDVASRAGRGPETSTPLHVECENGASSNVIKRLIEAYPEAVAVGDGEGRTPLHLAVRNREYPPSFEALYMLMAPGSDYEVLNTKDNSGEYPVTMEYLCQKAETIDSEKFDKSSALSCINEYLNAKLKRGYLPSYDDAIGCVSSLDHSPTWFREAVVLHPYIKAILNWRIVSNFSVGILSLDFYSVVMLIFCFRIASFEALNARSAAALGCSDDNLETCHNSYDDGKNISVPITLLYVGATYMTSRELMQAASLMYHNQFEYWLQDFWNWADCFSIGLIFRTTFQMSNGSGDDDTFRLLTVLTTGFLWIEAFSVLRTINQNCAVFITGLANMALTLRPFLLTLGLFLIAFAQMYLTQYLGTNVCPPPLNTEPLPFSLQNNFCTVTNSYLKVYLMFAGNGVDESEFTNNSTTLILSVCFSFTILILLLNILIAIVTDSYGELEKKSQIVFWSERMSFIHEVGQTNILYRVIMEKLELFQRCSNGTCDIRSPEKSYSNELGEFVADHELGQGLKVLWDIAMLALEDRGEPEVLKIKRELRRTWKPNMILAKYIDPYKFLSFVVTSRFARLCVMFLIPYWILLGFLSAGYLWPSQVKKWLLCPHINKKCENSEPLTKADVMQLSDERRQALMTLEDNLKEKWADVHSQIHEVNGGVYAIKNEQKAINRKHSKMEKEVVDIRMDMGKIQADINRSQMDIDLIRKDVIEMNRGITDIKSMLKEVLNRDDV